MRCLREQKWEIKKRQNAGGVPELRYRSREPSNKRWCPVELQGQGTEPKQWSLLWKALGRQVPAFLLASMCCDIAILYPSSIPPDPVLRGQWHCPEVTISFLEARRERGIPGLTALEVNSYAYCLYQVWLSKETAQPCLSRASGPKCSESSSGSRAAASAPFNLSLYLVLGAPCGICGNRRLWRPVSRDPGNRTRKLPEADSTAQWHSVTRFPRCPGQIFQGFFWDVLLSSASQPRHLPLPCFSPLELFALS